MSRENILVLFTILVLYRSLANCIVCIPNIFCETNFVKHKISIEGCNSNIQVPDVSRAWCATQCSNLNSCTVFSYVGNLCTHCEREGITGFSQTNVSGPFYLARAIAVKGINSGEVYFPPNDVLGRMIFYDFTVTANTIVGLDIKTIKGDTALAVHCRLVHQTSSNATALNSFINNQWLSPEILIKNTFTVKVGKRSVMYVLITASEFIIWIDGFFISKYAHKVPLNEIEWIEGKGPVLIHELSL